MKLDKNIEKFVLMGVIALVVFLGYNKGRSEDNLLVKNEKQIEESDNTLSEKARIFVHITGEIAKDGVYELEEGSRLVDLIKLAGGLTAMAEEKSLNLAMKLEDEMKIHIPKIGELAEEAQGQGQISGLYQAPSKGADKVNINTADKEKLMSLPSVGPKTAEKIIEYRASKKFQSIDEIKEVPGIGEKTFESLKELITTK